jgi:metal-sulfur cluster biosynthetic enzyme
MPLDNAEPVIHQVDRSKRQWPLPPETALKTQIFEAIRDIRDPEHPNTLEELAVVTPDSVSESSRRRYIQVTFTPTVPHCSLAALIGLCIRQRLVDLRLAPTQVSSLPAEDSQRYATRLKVLVAPETHVHWQEITKQLNDKERVLSAFENTQLRAMIADCMPHP